MCGAVCGGVGGEGELGAKTDSLLSGEERQKCEDTQSGDELRLPCSRAWTCGCGLGVLGEVRAQKLLEQEYWQVGVATQAPDESFSSEYFSFF